MKNARVFGLSVLLTIGLLPGCAGSGQYRDESMYDLAAQLKELAQTVDGEVKFGAVPVTDGEHALQLVAKAFPEKLAPFAEYTLRVELQEENAVLLLCERDQALMEDAGCNAVFDKTHWQASPPQPCTFTLDSRAVCQ